MRTTLTLLSLLALMVFGLATTTVAQEHEHGKMGEMDKMQLKGEVTVSGEVLDMGCYMAHEAKGPDHAACAKRCAKQGQPLGLLTADGKVYLLYASHDDGSAFEKTKEYAGEKVTISGEASTQAGIAGIEVHSVKPH